MPSGSGSGCRQDADLLARREQVAQLDHAVQVLEVVELVVEVVADQRAQAAESQAGVDREIAGVELVGKHEHRCDRHRFAHRADGGAHEADLFTDDAEDVAFARIQLADRLGREPALERAKAGRTHARLVVARNPGEFLVLAGADATPEPSQLGSVAHDDAAFHAISLRPALEAGPRIRPRASLAATCTSESEPPLGQHPTVPLPRRAR